MVWLRRLLLYSVFVLGALTLYPNATRFPPSIRRASASAEVYSESVLAARVCEERTKRRIDLPIVLTVVLLLVELKPIPVASSATGVRKKLNSLRTALAICAWGARARVPVSLSES